MRQNIEIIRTHRSIYRLLFGAVIMLFMVFMTAQASAVTVPKITVDQTSLLVKNSEKVHVTGTVSPAKGQTIALYAGDGNTVLAQVTAGSSGNEEAFQINVPDSAVKRPGKTTLQVRSMQGNDISASKTIELTVKAMKTQSVSGPASVTLTNLKKTAVLKGKASSGLAVTYTSSKPKVVSVSSSGKITRKKNGTAVITIRQRGNDNYLAAEKKTTVRSRKSNRKEQIDAAVAWAVRIAKDNHFTYGSGSGAHHNGCFFCGTNYGPRKYMKPSKKYKKTYCCNPYIHAAYAHGAQNPNMLAGCKRADGIGMEKKTFYKFKCWKCVGKPKYKNLQKGDVLVKSTHVAMYIGKGKFVEASGGTWSASSIAVKKLKKSEYNGFSYVMRYTGY